MITIIGAGVAGLTCAHYLHRHGIPFTILEASDAVGGRVRTDVVDGFRLDRGFQIFLTSYPEAKRILDYDALQLRAFKSGALVRLGGRLHAMPNPLKHPLSAPQALLAPVGSLGDKLNILRLSTQVKGIDDEAFAHEAESATTVSYLSGFGYSEKMIRRFFQPFFSGVFLEKELRTRDGFFRFLFKQFATGDAVLPTAGIQAIPEQLAVQLPPGSIRLNASVQAVEGRMVRLQNGEAIESEAVVVATDAAGAARLLGQPEVKFNATECLYFAATASPLPQPMLALNADNDGVVNHVAVLTDVVPEYAPAGQALISANVVGESGLPEAELAAQVQRELTQWFGSAAATWRHLRTYRIPHALPQYFPDSSPALPLKINDFTYRCGDYTAYPSLNGAMRSGREVAEQLVLGRFGR
ncbi:MAG: FAD-dependent oxidoreductase [Cytophagales bacterium]|jgi:protoporphyrinogen oxidase|nr:FAD-dependent oxidoreductase [Cytophagales bacterium]